LSEPTRSRSLQYAQVVFALIIREITTRYGRSPGGYVWAFLEPVATIAILSIAFSQFAKNPPLGENFAVFFATGFIPFHIFNDIAANGGTAVLQNRPLMRFPVVTPFGAVIARFILSLGTQLIVGGIVFLGLFLIVGQPENISIPPLLLAIASAAILGLGVGTTNALLFSLFPVWRNIWAIISRSLFVISGVFFIYEQVPEHLQKLLWWNPLTHVVGETRRSFYPSYEGAYISIWYVFLIGILFFIVGGILLVRFRGSVIESE